MFWSFETAAMAIAGASKKAALLALWGLFREMTTCL
jgi:hypothetical protein